MSHFSLPFSFYLFLILRDKRHEERQKQCGVLKKLQSSVCAQGSDLSTPKVAMPIAMKERLQALITASRFLLVGLTQIGINRLISGALNAKALSQHFYQGKMASNEVFTLPCVNMS